MLQPEEDGASRSKAPFLHKEQAVCLAGIVALSLPLDDQALGEWNIQLLRHVVEMLGLKPEHVEALRPLIHCEGNDLEIRKVQADAFMRGFTPSDDTAGAGGLRSQAEYFERIRYLALRNLVVHLASKYSYDARTRMVMRRLAECMGVSWYLIARIEVLTASDLHDIWEASHAKDKIHKGWRYAKIGAAAAVGGTLLALTGGMAAPAISVGLAAMGSTSAVMAAGYATATTVATLFGASGAGLVGYKVGRRTAGVTKFEFHKNAGASGPDTGASESGKDKDKDKGAGATEDDAKMVLCICISGWLVDDEAEFQVPWGVEPNPEFLTARLRLFYKLHNPDNIKHADMLALEYRNRRAELAKRCLDRYGVSPFDCLTPATPSPLTSIPDEERAEVLALIQRQRPTRQGGQSSGEDGEEQKAEGLLRAVVELSSPAPSRHSSLASCRSASPPLPFAEARAEAQAALGGGEEEEGEAEEEGEGEAEGEGDKEGVPEPSTPADVVIRIDQDSEEGEEEDGAAGKTGGEGAEVEETLARVPKEISSPWFHEDLPFFDHYTLHWEPSILMDLGHSVMELVASMGQTAMLEILSYTAAATLVSALAWPITLLQAADYIDGTWSVCSDRADRAGRLLAQVLMRREHGSRPVFLMGYSMGARVIVSCLFELARVHREWERAEERRAEGGGRSPKAGKGRDKEKEREREKKERQNPDGRRGSPAAGLIHTVVLMGTPLPCDEKAWAALQTVVADRIVHCYSKRDWMLGLMYRYSSLSLKVCGLRAINVPGVQNVDVSRVIGGHQEYATKIRDVLRLCNLEDALPRPGVRRENSAFASFSSASFSTSRSFDHQPSGGGGMGPSEGDAASAVIDGYFDSPVAEGEEEEEPLLAPDPTATGGVADEPAGREGGVVDGLHANWQRFLNSMTSDAADEPPPRKSME